MDNSLDAFAPLTEAELADAARQVQQDLEADATKPTCPPLDAENGVLAAARLYGCKPDMFWRYETTEAETAFYVVRWNEGDKKVILPLSWFDGAGWKFGAWPNNCPLYNLPAITEQPNAPIVICEGEKTSGRSFADIPQEHRHHVQRRGWRGGENRLGTVGGATCSHLAGRRRCWREIRTRSRREAQDV